MLSGSQVSIQNHLCSIAVNPLPGQVAAWLWEKQNILKRGWCTYVLCCTSDHLLRSGYIPLTDRILVENNYTDAMVTLFGKEKASKSSYGPDVGDNIGTSVSHLKTTLSKHSFASFRCFEKHSTKQLWFGVCATNLSWTIGSWLGPHPILTTKEHTLTRTSNLKDCSGTNSPNTTR